MADFIFLGSKIAVDVTAGVKLKDTFGLCGRRRGWDVSREQHRNMYIIYSETDHQPRLDAWDKWSGLVHWEDPEELGGEGGGWGDQDGEYM